VATLLTAGALAARGGGEQPPVLSRIGHDFLPFYAAGSLLREGRAAGMYDIGVLRAREEQVARENGIPLGGFGPFWNPPFYALAFVPLSALPFRAAMLTWLGLNLAALAGATALLCRVITTSGPAEAREWRTWGLVPLLVILSVPFFLALTHGQNTFGSLLLLTLAVLAWRARRAVLAGLVVGLLVYKPQLAAVVGVVALIDLGWRFAAGALLSAGALLLGAAVAMPGIFETYADAMPRLLHYMQVEQVYLWERHATLKAFWRLLVQGKAPGEVSLLVNVLTVITSAALASALIAAALKCRGTAFRQRRDRLIAATIAAMPLLMPFYFDYDLLLLAIPAVLYAAEASLGGAGRLILPAFCAPYVWLVINPDVAVRTGVNGAVPLLALVAGLLIARALRRGGETAQCVADTSPAVAAGRAMTTPLAAAA
jgi:hypothetical protein